MENVSRASLHLSPFDNLSNKDIAFHSFLFYNNSLYCISQKKKI